MKFAQVVRIRRANSRAVYAAALIAATVMLTVPTGAYAETAADFLKSIEGNYSGRGKALLIGDKLDTVACKINSDFNSGKLSVAGECASTKGKGKVNGGISANGNKVSGTFVAPRPNLEITQSSGQFSNGKMILSASLLDNQKGGLIRVRQVISKTGNGLKAEFYRFDNKSKSYKSSGSISLKKR